MEESNYIKKRIKDMKKDPAVLPKTHVFETPMVLKTDAYTVGSNSFQSKKARQNSVYHAVHRLPLHKIDPDLYRESDDRIILVGLMKTIDELFRKRLTSKQLKRAINSLEEFKYTKNGMKPFPFPKKLWKEVVRDYNGRPPIVISSLREGSVIYPGEPFLQVKPSPGAPKRFGELAAWFEPKLLQIYSLTERVTQNEHFLLRIKERINSIDIDLAIRNPEIFEAISRSMLVDFGDRAGFNQTESEQMGMAHLYTFPGTDNLSGNYQAFMQTGKIQGNSILALAHRNVQSFDSENECYEALNNVMEYGDLGSFVSDLNNYKTAIQKFITPLILKNQAEDNQKVIVARPDSGDVNEQVIWTLNHWKISDVYQREYVNIKGNKYIYFTYAKLILADGLTLPKMIELMDLVSEAGFLFWKCIGFGSGGGLRNSIKRDNLSTKFALNAVGLNNEGVAKFSEHESKGTLPGPFKVLRSDIALNTGETVVHESEYGENMLEIFFDGSDIITPFKEPMNESFDDVKNRIKYQMETMPRNIRNSRVFLCSDKLYNMRDALRTKNVIKVEEF